MFHLKHPFKGTFISGKITYAPRHYSFLLISAGFALLGVIIFGAKASEVFESAVGTLHAGFGLAIVALIAAALAGSLIFLARTKN